MAGSRREIMSDRILMGHGHGGKLTDRLIRDKLLPLFDNEILRRLGDSAILSLNGTSLAFSTDSYVVSPLFFPGGDIGRLAIAGTVNDLAVSGAKPLYLSVGFIIEEGFPMEDLLRISRSIHSTAQEAGVLVVTGDTKVVNRGGADRMFLNTSGIGVLKPGVDTSGARVRPGDKVFVSGTLGDHGISVMAKREGLAVDFPLSSDVAPLNGMIEELLELGEAVHFLRDPTRGGLASSLNELVRDADFSVELREKSIPVRQEVRGTCELLGLDPLYVANEGKCVAVIEPQSSTRALEILRAHPLGENAQEIGTILAHPSRKVIMKTEIGGTRIVDAPVGEQLPRIC
jgi:hydrogenase expression/formation protein HypE